MSRRSERRRDRGTAERETRGREAEAARQGGAAAGQGRAAGGGGAAAAGGGPAGGGPAGGGAASRRGSAPGWGLGVQIGFLVVVFGVVVLVAELAGAANLGVALGIGQIAFAIAVVYLLLRR